MTPLGNKTRTSYFLPVAFCMILLSKITDLHIWHTILLIFSGICIS
jgi:hypothetical protein